YADLESRRDTILNSIEKQGKLSDDLKARIVACYSKSELEDLYLPYKPKRKTKAAIAIERGLEPLANYLWEQTGEQPAGEFAERFINLEREILTIESAIEGALHIIAERVAETPEFRKQLRDAMMTEGVVRAKVVTGKETEKTRSVRFSRSAPNRKQSRSLKRTFAPCCLPHRPAICRLSESTRGSAPDAKLRSLMKPESSSKTRPFTQPSPRRTLKVRKKQFWI